MTDSDPHPGRDLTSAQIHTLRRLAQLLRRLPPGTTIESALAAGLINDARLGWALRPMGDAGEARRWLGLPELRDPRERAEA